MLRKRELKETTLAMNYVCQVRWLDEVVRTQCFFSLLAPVCFPVCFSVYSVLFGLRCVI